MNDKTIGADIEQTVATESFPETTNERLNRVNESVSMLVAKSLNLSTNNPPTKEELKEAEIEVKTFLEEENIRADLLLDGNYEAALRTLAPSFIKELNANIKEEPNAKETDIKEIDNKKKKLKEFLSHSGIIIALLVPLRKQSKFADRIERDPEQTKLDQLVKSFVDKNGTSPSDAISILRSVES